MNAKFWVQYFYMDKNIYGDFQICISVPLKSPANFTNKAKKCSYIVNTVIPLLLAS